MKEILDQSSPAGPERMPVRRGPKANPIPEPIPVIPIAQPFRSGKSRVMKAFATG